MSTITRARDSVMNLATKENSSSSDDNKPIAENVECLTNELYGDVKKDPSRVPFLPQKHGLPSDFRLTKYGDVKSRGTMPSREFINACIAIFHEDTEDESCENSREAIFQDSPMILDEKTLFMRLERYDLILLETGNTMTPLIDDPYAMGKIACLSVLSGIYALGIVEIATTRMSLSIPTRMETAESEIVAPMIIRGYRDAAQESQTSVTYADITINPWCLIGGTASAVCTRHKFVPPDGAALGDVIVLTKPLGTSIALTAYQWLEQPERRKRLTLLIDENSIKKAKQRAVDSMLKSNREAAVLMTKYNAHAACEVTTHGILSPAKELAKRQRNPVNFVIHNLPVIAKMHGVSRLTGDTTKLLRGLMPEYSGGLMLVLPREQAAAYCKVYDRIEHRQAWIIGLVEEGQRQARVIERPRVIEVPAKETDLSLW